MVWIALSAIWAIWLIFTLLWPDAWSHIVDKETDFWVRKGLVKPALAEKCSRFEKGKGMKILLSVGLLAFAGNIILNHSPIIFLFTYKRSFSKNEQLSVQPQQLHFDEIVASRTNLYFGGYSFGVPWDDLVHVHTGKTASAIGYFFDNKSRIFLFSGNNNCSYEWAEQILSTTPDDLSMMQTTNEAMRVEELLRRKDVLMVGRSTIQYFSTHQLIGFQMGHPETDSFILIELFDKDRSNMVMSVSMSTHSNLLTQGEINCVLNSMEKISEPITRGDRLNAPPHFGR